MFTVMVNIYSHRLVFYIFAVILQHTNISNVGDSGSIPGSRREQQPTLVFLPGESMDRGAWWATVHGITEIWT